MASSGGFIDKNGYLVRRTFNNDTFIKYCGFSLELKNHGVSNLWDILEYGSAMYPSEPCLGTRNVLEKRFVKEGGKLIEKHFLDDYRWMSYTEVKEKSVRIGSGLRNLGNKAAEIVAIFAETRAEWLISAMGCFYQGIILVTLYNTLSDEALIHALNETEAKTMFISYQMLPRVLKLKKKYTSLSTLIVMENDVEDINEFYDDKGFLRLIKFKDLLCTGKGYTQDSVYLDRSNEDTAIVMYTSGSTGIPKGVELSHKNILASVFTYPSTMHINSSDRYLAFLPLAHIMELIAEVSCIAIKVPILYSSPTTLTSKSIRVMAGCLGDAKAGKPTFTMSVPLVLDRIIKGVYKKVSEGGYIKTCIFNFALRIKMWLNNASVMSAILDILIFNSIKEELGGHLKIIGVGGSPLSEQTHNTMRAMFGCSLRVGYGATETAACVSGMDWQDNTTGHVGPPNFGVYVQLTNDIQSEDAETNTVVRGEIHAGGDIIAKRYFKRPEETCKCFYDEGGIRWFITGDIGEKTTEGCLKIVDRKRDYIKLKHGEYISLLKIESTFKSHMLIENICVTANPFKENVAALLMLSVDNACMFPHIFKLVSDAKGNLKSLYSKKNFNKVVLNELCRYGKEMGLSKWEIPAAIYITSDIWSTESGLLTGSFKIRRKEIERTYEDKIKKMFQEIE